MCVVGISFWFASVWFCRFFVVGFLTPDREKDAGFGISAKNRVESDRQIGFLAIVGREVRGIGFSFWKGCKTKLGFPRKTIKQSKLESSSKLREMIEQNSKTSQNNPKTAQHRLMGGAREARAPIRLFSRVFGLFWLVFHCFLIVFNHVLEFLANF